VRARVKYGIKKKETMPTEDPGLDGRLGRKKKTPEEMEAEANGELPAGATGEGNYRHCATWVVRRNDVTDSARHTASTEHSLTFRVRTMLSYREVEASL